MAADPNISGQMCDPGRTKQIAAGQHPSGQCGVQVGRVAGVPVTTGTPTDGTEAETGRKTGRG